MEVFFRCETHPCMTRPFQGQLVKEGSSVFIDAASFNKCTSHHHLDEQTNESHSSFGIFPTRDEASPIGHLITHQHVSTLKLADGNRLLVTSEGEKRKFQAFRPQEEA